MISKLKVFIEKHSWLFFFFRFVPYSLRLGKAYNEHKRLQHEYEFFSKNDKDNFHYLKLKKILDYAYYNNDFYRSFYDSRGYNPSSFKKLDDFKNVPIVKKSDLKNYALKKRSCCNNSPFKVNTGGTSGEPLEFYLDKRSFAREWAYMHKIWGKLGYSYLDAKLAFRGKNNGGEPLTYNVIHNEYVVDAYVSYEELTESIRNLCKNKKINYLHGYPSSIYAFCKHIKDNNIDVLELFNGKLKGVFFGFEYPAPVFRDLIENTLEVKSVSWYGHSEMAILAYEKSENFTYYPFQTYGFVEVESDPFGEGRLLGTSYYNFNSPFIRYDTGDLVSDTKYSDDVLYSFRIASGRIGDFIFDKENNPISLTALIFGRHHDAFNKIDFLQIGQEKIGEATLFVTSRNSVELSDFDLNNVNIKFFLQRMEKPVKTNAGKIPLFVSQP
ncbi:hypothetical protein AB6D28_015075 [Vibrio cyclitrophicus]